MRVLVYHRVEERGGLWGDPALISARPKDFGDQMAYLVRHYTPITSELLLEVVRGRAVLPPRAVLVTFDDGYRDFLTRAWPILRAHGVPAVLFVPTAFPDTGRRFWWDLVYESLARTAQPSVAIPDVGAFALRTSRQRWAAIRQVVAHLTPLRGAEIRRTLRHLQEQLGPVPAGAPPVLTWAELRRLAREGVTIASHTRTHCSVPRLSGEEVVREVRGARADLQRELGEAPPLFGYPFGHPGALDVLRMEGIAAAFTAYTSTPALNIMGRADPLLLHREPVNGTGSFVEFGLGLTSLYTVIQSAALVRDCRRRVREWAVSRGPAPDRP